MSRLFLLLCCLSLLTPYSCNRYEQENDRLREEIKMLREQNDYAQAEIIGLKKELAELSARVKDEREAPRRKSEEERGLVQKKTEEMHETMQKKAEADKKKSTAAAKKEQAKNNTSKKPLPSSGAGTVEKDQPQKSAGSGWKEVKEAGTEPGAQKARDSKKPTGESPGEE